jgi:dihydrofolate synthase/folylpolyglutamate synthase
MGRWQKIQANPIVICDTGHNKGGIQYIVEQLSMQKYNRLHIVIGMVNDKDISGVLALLPKNATYYFTNASVSRALPATEVQKLAKPHGLSGNTYNSVKEAYETALSSARPDDFIFVGGSTFIVADLLSTRQQS